MSYASGEVPCVGDQIVNLDGQTGTVLHAELCARQIDGIDDLLYIELHDRIPARLSLASSCVLVIRESLPVEMNASAVMLLTH